MTNPPEGSVSPPKRPTPAENYLKYKPYYKAYYQEYGRINKAKLSDYQRLYRLYKSPSKLTNEEQEIKIIKAPITIYFS
jgi:hypothetical protein